MMGIIFLSVIPAQAGIHSLDILEYAQKKNAGEISGVFAAYKKI